SDAVVLREFDLSSKTFVSDGYRLPEAKGETTWLDPDTLLLTSAWGGEATTSGYARTVRLWRRGTDPAPAPGILQVPRQSGGISVLIDRTEAAGAVWFFDTFSYFDALLRFARSPTGEQSLLDLPTDIQIDARNGWVAVKRRTPWTIAGKTWPGDTVLGIRLDAL